MSTNDGGPAFPTPYLTRDGDHYSTEYEFGMTLRDYFAAKALTGVIGRSWADDKGNVPGNVMELWAAAAYKTADAMLAARGAA